MTKNNTNNMVEYYVSKCWGLDMSNGGQFPLLLVIDTLLGLGKGGVPGFATIANALVVATSPTNISGGLSYAVALQVPISTMIDLSAAWLHYKYLRWDAIRILLPVSFLGMAMGQWLDQHVLNDSSARLLTGMLLLFILSYNVLGKNGKNEDKARPKKDVDDDESNKNDDDEALLSKAENGSGFTTDIEKNETVRNKLPKRICKNQYYDKTFFVWSFLVGMIGGAASMLTNNMGPILNIFLLSIVKLSPREYIGTRSMFILCLNVGKLFTRVFVSGTISQSMLPLAACLVCFAIVGVFVAKPIMLSMSEKQFVRLELIVVAISGVRLCYMGLT